MEKYSLLDTLKAEAESNDWVFLSGDDFYQNYESTMQEYEAGQFILGCDFIASDQYNNSGSTLEAINYIGSIRFGRKKDSDDTYSNLDETYIQKHERRLKDLKIALSNFISNFACSNQLNITNSVGLLEINKFDANIDFVGLQITFNQEDFTIIPTTYTVDLSSTTGGEAISSLGGEGVYTNVAKDSNEAFNATAESGSRFARWLLNGVENSTNPLALIIKKNYTIVAEFIESFILNTSVYGNGTITPSSGDYDSGSEVTITATPNDVDTILSDIQVNNISVGNTSPYVFNIIEYSSVVAYFIEKPSTGFPYTLPFTLT